MVDDELMESMTGVRLRLHSPRMREIVMVHDKPWEGNCTGSFSVLRDGAQYRMYYRGWHGDEATEKELHEPVMCLAESDDGIAWRRPNLGGVRWRGSTENNIVWTGKGCLAFTVFKDPNPECAADARYKAVGVERDKSARPGGERVLYALKSADGRRWSLLRDEPLELDATGMAFDSQNVVFWDRVRGEYRIYFRDWHYEGDRPVGRDIKTAISRDFIHWSKSQWLAYPDSPNEELYTSQILPYDRAPELFLGFPTRYIENRGSLTEGLFMSSRDGRMFRRWGEALIRPGRNIDRWRNRSNYIWLGLVETKSDLPGDNRELSLYTNEAYYKADEGSKTRRHTFRIDGFVSANAPLAGGEFVTRPLTFQGCRLRLNVATSAAGSVRIEIRDATGAGIPGFGAEDCDEIFGDDLNRVATWRGRAEIGHLAGVPVRLRFIIKDADVYAFGTSS
jgi:hypothetical protein